MESTAAPSVKEDAAVVVIMIVWKIMAARGAVVWGMYKKTAMMGHHNRLA